MNEILLIAFFAFCSGVTVTIFVLSLCMSAKRSDEKLEDIWRDHYAEERKRFVRDVKPADFDEPPNVFWRCLHCGHWHEWHWDDQADVKDRGPIIMFCDRCDDETKCLSKGDGRFYPAGQSIPKAKLMTDFDEPPTEKL